VPKFLENALRHEGKRKGLAGKHLERYIYGGMNNIGAMRGSKETAKGAAMERKHESDQKKGSRTMEPKESPQTMKGMNIQIHRDGEGKVTGHMITHEFEPRATKSGAFMERPKEATHMFGPKGEKVGAGMPMMAHLGKHLGIGAAASPKTEETEMDPSEPEGHQAAAYEEDSEGE
jgi:hypothetical protein